MTPNPTGLLFLFLALTIFSLDHEVLGQNEQLLTGKRIELDTSKFKVKDLPLSKIFKDHKLYKFEGALLLKKSLKLERFSEMQLTFGEAYEWDLHLEEYDLKTNGYIRRESGKSGIEESQGNSITTYRGFANGNQTHKTRITLIKDQLSGVVLQGDEEIYFEPAQKYLSNADSNVYIIYKGSDVIPSANANCGLAEAKETLNNLGEKNIDYATAAYRVCRSGDRHGRRFFFRATSRRYRCCRSKDD